MSVDLHYGWFWHTKDIAYPTTTQNPQITITDTPKTTQTPQSPTPRVVLAYKWRYIPNRHPKPQNHHHRHPLNHPNTKIIINMGGFGILKVLFTQPPPKTPKSPPPTPQKPPKYLNHQHYGCFGILEALFTQPLPKTPKSPSATPQKPPKHLNHQHYG